MDVDGLDMPEGDVVAALRAALAELPDGAPVFIECSLGWRYDVIKADVWGSKTDQPYLRLLLRHPQDPRRCREGP